MLIFADARGLSHLMGREKRGRERGKIYVASRKEGRVGSKATV